jgi:predicted glycogen debranching enzyme
MESTQNSNAIQTLWDIGRGDLEDFEQAAKREWLITNGLGGFAAGTVADANTRRYHGLLVAALKPPLQRTVMLAGLDVMAQYNGVELPLSTNEFTDGTIAPRGHVNIERFRLEHGLPIWEYAFNDALIEKRIIMPHGENTTLVRYRVLRASSSLRLTLRPLCSHRDYHSHMHGGWDFQTSALADGYRIDAYHGAAPYFIRTGDSVTIQPATSWYWHFRHRVEATRGLDDSEDLYSPGTIECELAEGEVITLTVSTLADRVLDFDSMLQDELARRQALLKTLPQAVDDTSLAQLVYAADQFIVSRGSDTATAGKTVIAGYPWFGDWGRDTMIALPGLTLSSGRYDIANSILRTFAVYLDAGMLPNRFPDHGEEPEYNTVDATLWYVHAVHQYTRHSNDTSLAAELFDSLIGIIDWHNRGTRYNIHIDPEDGLLWSGESGVQLTWMDAKIGEWVVTPRIGKAVEINALWYNALMGIAELATSLGKQEIASQYTENAARVAQSFTRFWNEGDNCLYDVIDGPAGIDPGDGHRYDASIRPNQLFAVSLPHSPLDADQQRAVVDICARELVTSFGLRSLATTSADYTGNYHGGPFERDSAYHQGTVWAWLLPPLAEAHYRVYGDAARARSYLRPMFSHLREACVGSISEIFDGDAPYLAHGCFAQAWSVAELLRVWLQLDIPATTMNIQDEPKEATHEHERTTAPA